jgi:DNA-binding response OmpR family regulator
MPRVATSSTGHVSVAGATRPAADDMNPLRVDPVQRLVAVGTARAWLQPREMDLLMVLIENDDRVLPRSFIYEEAWQAPFDPSDRVVDVYVRRVRACLEKLAPEWTFIHTHHRGGYRFTPERRQPAG